MERHACGTARTQVLDSQQVGVQRHIAELQQVEQRDGRQVQQALRDLVLVEAVRVGACIRYRAATEKVGRAASNRQELQPH